LPEPVDFEAGVYVAGSSVIGIDGWKRASIGFGTNQVTSTSVLEGTKSLQMADNGAYYIVTVHS